MYIIVVIFLVLIGFAVYSVKPRCFYLYWLSIFPYILPVIYILLKPAFTPFYEKFYPVLYYYPGALFFFMLLLFVISKNRTKELRILSLPLLLLILFIFLQNLFRGLDIRAFCGNLRDILWIVAPFLLLIVNKNVRLKRYSLIRFIFIFVYIQMFFCILNLIGFRIYGKLPGDFDTFLISGTFPRYNHMADFLALFFFLLSYEYMERKSVKKDKYLLMALLMGGMITLSGARMPLLLFVFTIIYFVSVSYNIKIVFLTSLVFVLLIGTYIIGNESFSDKKADEGSGFERNAIGIINLANSEDISQGSTLSLSAYLLSEKYNSALIGNGELYRGKHFYGNPNTDVYAVGTFMSDARLIFMYVEYGIIGLLLYINLFVSFLKGCYLYSSEHSTKLYWGGGLYFFFFSITDPGFWDTTLFTTFLIYTFSVEKKSGESNILPRQSIE